MWGEREEEGCGVLDAQTIGDGEGERGALAKAWVSFKFYMAGLDFMDSVIEAIHLYVLMGRRGGELGG